MGYYTFNVLAGVQQDAEGKEDDVEGCLYSYDAIGSFERVGTACTGSGTELITPLLDFVEKESKEGRFKKTQEACQKLVLDCFHVAAEKDIYTGDKVELCTITASGITRTWHDIRHD